MGRGTACTYKVTAMDNAGRLEVVEADRPAEVATVTQSSV